MAGSSDPDEVLCSTTGKTNFQRVTRLLICGGTCLLREIFDFICPPLKLLTVLSNPATKKVLKGAKLTKPQWDCLYPSPGVYGASTEFDVTLLFRLLRTVCGLTPPTTGWDVLPAPADHSLTADLVRIKYYRNSVYGHVNQSMEVTDDEFPSLWQEISGALVRIAGQISHSKKTEWRGAIDNFLKDPLTDEDEKNVEELEDWYKKDMDIKKYMEELKTTTQEGLDHLDTVVKGVQEGLEDTSCMIEEKVQCLETTIRKESQVIKDELKQVLKTTAQDVCEGVDRLNTTVKGVQAELEGTVRQEAEVTRKGIDRLETSVKGAEERLEELKTTTQEVRERTARLEVEAKDTKDHLGEKFEIASHEVRQGMGRLEEGLVKTTDVIAEKFQYLQTAVENLLPLVNLIDSPSSSAGDLQSPCAGRFWQVI